MNYLRQGFHTDIHTYSHRNYAALRVVKIRLFILQQTTQISWSKRRKLQEEMTEESSTVSHLSVAMTTTGMTQITGENAAASPSSPDIKFYFYCALVVIGVVGTATNGLILYALVASKQHKKHVLIFNQNVLDVFSSFFTVISYSLRLCNIHLTGSTGYWLCALLLSDCLIWCGNHGSVINLACITVERYLKVVHSVWSKKKLHKWTMYSAAVFSWIASFIYNTALMFPTTIVTPFYFSILLVTPFLS